MRSVTEILVVVLHLFAFHPLLRLLHARTRSSVRPSARGQKGGEVAASHNQQTNTQEKTRVVTSTISAFWFLAIASHRPAMTMSETPRATAINAPPPHLTSTEYEQATSSTPQSFADIPPRLVVQLENVTVQAQPALAGVANGKGTLWVTEG